MKKNIILMLLTLFIGLIVSLFAKFNQSMKLNNNNIFVILPFILIFSLPILKFLFPFLKNMGIGTVEFYPNILKSILNWWCRITEK